MLAHARTDPKALGPHSSAAAKALDDIVDATVTALNKLGASSSLPQEFTVPIKTILTELTKLESTKGDTPQEIDSAKVVTKATTDIIAAAKNLALNTTDPADRANMILATEKLATAATTLAKSTRTGIRDPQIRATRAAVHDLTTSVSSKGMDPASEQLLAATRSAADSTMKLLSSASGVCGNPRDNTQQNKLRSAALAIPSAVSAVQNAAIGMNPGVRECDEAISEIEGMIGELDAAAIGAAFGQLQGIPGKTHQDCTRELVGQVKNIAADVGMLRGDDPRATANGANKLKSDLPVFVGLVKAAAATTSNKDTQKNLIEMAKLLSTSLLDLLNSCKDSVTGKGSVQDVDAKAAASNEAIKSFASSLATGASNLRELEQALKDIQNLTQLLNSPADPNASYQTSKGAMKRASQDIVKGSSALVNAAKQDVNDLGTSAKSIVAIMPGLIGAVRDASASASSPEAAQSLKSGGESVIASLANFVATAREVANDPKDRARQAQLNTTFTKLTTDITGLLDTCYAGAVGERECEDASYQIGRVMADLDAFSLFAAAGQVDPNEIAPGKNYASCQTELKRAGGALPDTARKFETALGGSQDQLAASAKEMAKICAALAKYTKATGALGGDKQTQQKLIDACKKVEMAAQHQIDTGKSAFGKVKQDPALAQAASAASMGVVDAVGQLIQTADAAAAESARGIMEIDRANAFISDLIKKYGSPNWAGNSSADAMEVVKGARAVAAATGELVVGCGTSQEELVAATKQAAKSMRVLMQNAKGGGKTTDDKNVQQRLDTAAVTAANSVTKLLEQCKEGSKSQNLQAQARVSSAARECADSLQEVVSCANLLPGGEGLTLEEDTGEDLDVLAEKELQACAKVIENAARMLIDRPPSANIDDSALADVTEAILAAAIAIAQATAILVRAAHGAQRERVAKGNNPKTKHLYRKDPTWANGLISAAQKVAATTQHLVGSANDAAQGTAEEEVLVASAHAVAASTAQLVSASRAKAAQGSKTQMQLDAAAKAVAAATAQLVEAARAAAEAEREATTGSTKYELDSSAKAEMEQKIEILRLEKQLEDARRALAQKRKNQYK
eukprot:TRINITY_DN3475_c0_g2_i1.p1 TRINITY_DN3475_c0_g2~~TRINITY_DN3475_c0_g2_i1.p1  ORF type:complete len:1086 (+),score=325.41 TRINITY_DN3475_c0_g2_i1:91-3348(+)